MKKPKKERRHFAEILRREDARDNKFAKIVKRHKERESKIEGKVVKYAKKHLGAVVRKMDGFGFNHWPDRLFLLGGCPALFVEFKRKGKEPTPMQAELHRELRSMGYEVWVEDDAQICIGKLNAWYIQKQNEGTLRRLGQVK